MILVVPILTFGTHDIDKSAFPRDPTASLTFPSFNSSSKAGPCFFFSSDENSSNNSMSNFQSL